MSYLQKLKIPGFYTLGFFIFINNSRSKQNKKKISNTLFKTLLSRKRAKFQQKILNSMEVGVCQSFQFFRKNPGFLETIDLCLNLGIGFCITWLVLPNYKEISP